MRHRWANHLGNEDRNIYTFASASIHEPSTLESFLASIKEPGLTNTIFESRSHFMEGGFCKFGVHGKFERRKFYIVVVTKRISAEPLPTPLHVIQLAIPQIKTLQSLDKKRRKTYHCCKFLQENLVVDSTSTWLLSIVLSNHPKFLHTIRKIFLSRLTQSETKTNLRSAVAGRASGLHPTKPEKWTKIVEAIYSRTILHKSGHFPMVEIERRVLFPSNANQ